MEYRTKSKHAIKENIERARRRGRRSQQLLDDLKEKRRYFNLKEAALDCTLWGTRFGRGYKPSSRLATHRMNHCRSTFDVECSTRYTFKERE